jgi:hypothetical protein
VRGDEVTSVAADGLTDEALREQVTRHLRRRRVLGRLRIHRSVNGRETTPPVCGGRVCAAAAHDESPRGKGDKTVLVWPRSTPAP